MLHHYYQFYKCMKSELLQINFTTFRTIRWGKKGEHKQLGDVTALLQPNGSYDVYVRYSDGEFKTRRHVPAAYILAARNTHILKSINV